MVRVGRYARGAVGWSSLRAPALTPPLVSARRAPKVTVAAASKASLRSDKTPKRSPGSRTRRVSFAVTGAPGAVVLHAERPNCRPPDACSAPLSATRYSDTAAELSPFDSRPQLASGAARLEAEQQSGSAVPTAAAASDASHANKTPEAQAFLAAARARLEGLTRGSGSRRRSGDRTFELALPQPPVAAQPAQRGASLSQWAQHAETSPGTATAAASAARRHGAAPPLPRLPLNQTPGAHTGGALALTPPPLSPTPTPNSVVTPGPDTQGRQSHGRRSSRRIAAAAVEAETQTTPGMVAHDAAVGMTPPGGNWEAAADDDGGAPAAWGGYDDDDDGGNADAPVPTPASLVKRPRRPAGTPNKRLRAAFANRKSLAAAGLAVQDGGARRSTRDRMRPLEYWRNETKAYGRTHRSLPTVAAVTMRSPEPGWPAPEGRWVGQKLADAGAGPAVAPKGKKAGKKTGKKAAAPKAAPKSRARILSDSEDEDSSDSE